MNKNSSKQVVCGATLSYILIVLNAVYGMVITPFILSRLGQEEYGVYKTIAALSSALMVLDLGLGGTVTRYIAKYRAEKKYGEIPNFLALMLMETGVIIIIVAGICTCLYFFIEPWYSNTFTQGQIGLAQKLFIVLSINMILHIAENVVNGIITGYNDFIFGNGIKLVRLLARITLVVWILNAFPNSMALVLIDFVLTVFFLIVEIFWMLFKHKVRIKYDHFEKHLFSESFLYTGLMFLTSIINQVNGNLDNVVIGVVIGASAVTVYSMGLTIFGMFEQLSTSISGVMLPSITNVLQEENGLEKAKRVVVKVGRVQFMLLGAVFVGFLVLGKDFIQLWLGDGYEDVYIITLILMFPALLYLCVNVCLSILRAKNLLGFRTIVVSCTTLLNAIITYFGTKYYGYFAACIGTAVSLTLGVLICMNIYYHKKLGFNMIKIYFLITKSFFVPLVVSGFIIEITKKCFFSGSWIYLFCNVLIFCISYIILLWLIGLSKEERQSVKNRLKERKKINEKNSIDNISYS